MSIDSLDPQFLALYNLLRRDIESIRATLKDQAISLRSIDETLQNHAVILKSVDDTLKYHGRVLTKLNTGIGRLESSLEDSEKRNSVFREDMRNRLNRQDT